MDWKLDLWYELLVDATAGKGIASRRGAGRVRHLHGPLLWAQKLVEDRVFAIKKIPGATSAADLGTRHVGAKLLWEHLNRPSFMRSEGRSEMPLKAQV